MRERKVHMLEPLHRVHRAVVVPYGVKLRCRHVALGIWVGNQMRLEWELGERGGERRDAQIES